MKPHAHGVFPRRISIPPSLPTLCVPIIRTQAAEKCSAKAKRAVAGLMAELSINPSQRVALKQAGGLLLLLQFQR